MSDRDDQQEIGRNDPCPCGSGRKYKRCCEGRTLRQTTQHPTRLINPLTVGVVTIVVGALLVSLVASLAGSFEPDAPAHATDVLDREPGEPWEYDADDDVHYDPTHGHWHHGPPPPEHQR